MTSWTTIKTAHGQLVRVRPFAFDGEVCVCEDLLGHTVGGPFESMEEARRWIDERRHDEEA